MLFLKFRVCSVLNCHDMTWIEAIVRVGQNHHE